MKRTGYIYRASCKGCGSVTGGYLDMVVIDPEDPWATARSAMEFAEAIHGFLLAGDIVERVHAPDGLLMERCKCPKVTVEEVSK